MQPTSVLWRDLTFATGVNATYRISNIDGWEGRPSPRYEKQTRTRGHGAHPSPVWADERIVTIEGRCWSEDDRDRLFDELDRRFSLDAGEESLTVSVAARTLTAGAQLLRFDPALVTGDWGIGRFGWVAQWRCPDPLRYGPSRTVSTGLPTSGGGMAFPLFASGGMDFGALGDTGQLTLSNAGTAPAPIVFGVRGALPQGWELSATGDRLTYPVTVPAGQVIAVDTSAGTVLVEGTASRRANLTSADWITVPPMTTLTVQFTSLGGAYDAAARVTATVQDTYW